MATEFRVHRTSCSAVTDRWRLPSQIDGGL